MNLHRSSRSLWKGKNGTDWHLDTIEALGERPSGIPKSGESGAAGFPEGNSESGSVRWLIPAFVVHGMIRLSRPSRVCWS
jgi:hypothetical protein